MDKSENLIQKRLPHKNHRALSAIPTGAKRSLYRNYVASEEQNYCPTSTEGAAPEVPNMDLIFFLRFLKIINVKNLVTIYYVDSSEKYAKK